VPRLDFASLSGSTAKQQPQQSSSALSSSKGSVGFLTEHQAATLLSRLPGNLDLLAGSPRLAGGGLASARVGSQQPSSVCTGQQDAATARSAQGAAVKYAGLCSSARAAAASTARAEAPAAAGTTSSAGNSSSGSAGNTPAAAAGVVSGRVHGLHANTVNSSRDPLRPYSASTSHAAVQPQPSRDEWRAVAASCLTQRHAAKCRSPRPATQARGSSGGPGVRQQSAGAGSLASKQQHAAAVASSALQRAVQGGGDTIVAAAAAGAPVPSTLASPAAVNADRPPGFAVRKWESTGATDASTARRSHRAGAAAILAAAAAAAAASSGAATGRSQHAHTARGSSYGSPYSTYSPAERQAPGITHKPGSTDAAAQKAPSKASQGTASELPAFSNNHAQLLTARAGNKRVSCAAAGPMDAAAAAAAGEVNSPRTARQTAAAAAAGAAVPGIHGSGGTTSRSISSPRRTLGTGTAAASTAHQAAATLETSRQHKQAAHQGQGQQSGGWTKCGHADRASSGSSADCVPASDTSRQAPGNTPRCAQQEPGCTPAAVAADSPVGQRGHGSVLDASCKYLLSACAVPPAALLSPRYQGPVETAVLKSRMHTPRH
jgi:hypothetical protein